MSGYYIVEGLRTRVAYPMYKCSLSLHKLEELLKMKILLTLCVYRVCKFC